MRPVQAPRRDAADMIALGELGRAQVEGTDRPGHAPVVVATMAA